MRYLTSSLLIISFIGIAVFGFAIFDHSMHNPSSDCVASVIDGVVCPTNILNMALHHISVLQTFSQALIPSTVSILAQSLFVVTARIKRKLFRAVFRYPLARVFLFVYQLGLINI